MENHITLSRMHTPVEFWGSLLLVLFLLFLAVNAFFQPIAAASGFGVPLVDALDAFYLLVKSDRDLGSALALSALLWLGHRRALGLAVAGLSIEPIMDACLVSADSRGSVTYALAIHGSAALYAVFLSWRLLRRSHS